MKRRITIEVDDNARAYIVYGRNMHGWEAAQAGLLKVLRVALGVEGPDPCPTCDGVGCDRCFNTGRRHLCKIAIYGTTTGRGTVDVWQGAPGTMQLVATTTRDRDVADITINAMLACLRDGGLVVDDRRDR